MSSSSNIQGGEGEAAPLPEPEPESSQPPSSSNDDDDDSDADHVVLLTNEVAMSVAAGGPMPPLVNATEAIAQLTETQRLLKARVEAALAAGHPVPAYIMAVYKNPWLGFGTDVTPEQFIAQHGTASSSYTHDKPKPKKDRSTRKNNKRK